MDFAALQHSVFLQALGSAILNSLWQCFILWLIYETISVSYKAASARFKNNLATLLLFLSFAWFLSSVASKIFNRHHVAYAAIPNGVAVELKAGAHTVSGFSEFLSYASASLPYLSVAYIFLLFFLTSRLFAAYRYVYFISNKRLMTPTRELQFFASNVASEIGITKKIGVWISHHIDVPATIGFFKPVILIPLASINNLSGQQLEAIILHELAHIRRNDYVTNLIISVIETVLFFNPFVVLLSNIIKRERENCCDDFVLQYRYDPHSYASALLRLEQSRMSKLKLAIGAVSGKKQLLSRIKRITNRQVVSRQFNYGQKIMALLLVTGIICSVAWLSPEEKKPVAQNPIAKNNNVAVLSKAKPANKTQPRVAVTVAARANETLLLPGVKHASPRIDPVAPPAVPETDVENALANNFSSDDDENSDQPDLTGGGTNVDFSEVAKGKQPEFYFDDKTFKLHPFTSIQNFLLQNMNIDIDLGKIDVDMLNKNLKLAYKEINNLDWNKVQGDIRRSFAKMKPGKLPLKDAQAMLFEKAKVLPRVNVIHAEQLYNTKEMLDQIKTQMEHDSLHILEMALPNSDNIEMTRVYNQVARVYERKRNKNNGNGDNYYFNYSTDSKTTGNNNVEEDETAACDKARASATTTKKTLQITIRRDRNNGHTGVLSTKKGFQFYFSKDDDEKPNQENVIRVEVND